MGRVAACRVRGRRDDGGGACSAPTVVCVCSAWRDAQERLFDQSDAYRIHVCERSGLIAVANLKKQQFSSQIYKADSSVVQVRCWCGVKWHRRRGLRERAVVAAGRRGQVRWERACRERGGESESISGTRLSRRPWRASGSLALTRQRCPDVLPLCVCRCSSRTPASCCSRSSWPCAWCPGCSSASER